MSVFYRTNSLSRVIEDELRNSGIPYQIARGTAFYDRKEIKDALAYLRVISNPDDEINLLRIINLPARGISAKTVKAMQARAAATGAHLPKLLTRIQEIPALPSRATNAVRQFAAQLDRWRSQKESIKITLRAFVEQVLPGSVDRGLTDAEMDAYFYQGMTDEQKAAARQHFYWIADLYQSSGRDKKFETTYAEIQKIFGTDDDLLGRLAGFYRGKGRYVDARACYSRFENRINGNSGIAETYYAEKKIEPCVMAYRRNVALDTKNPNQWHSTIAGTYRAVGQYDKAIAIYQELLKADLKNTQTWLWNIATTYRDWRKDKEAIGFFRQCTNFPSNYSEMAMCHRTVSYTHLTLPTILLV